MSWKSQRVLITGGAGFIGSNLALHLHELGANIDVIDNFSPYCGSNAFNLSEIEKRVHLHREDMTTFPLENLVADKDVIFHLAGQIGHQFGQQKPELDLEMNVVSSLKLLEACRKKSPNARLIFTGTRQVFGEPQYLPVDEKHPVRPLDVNGIHKAAAENYFLHYAKVYGLKTCVLRLTNTFGPRQSIRNNQLGVVGWLISRVLNNETLTIANGGKQVRDFTFVDDVVEALLLCAHSDAVHGQAFNLNGPKANLKQLAETLIELGNGGRLGELTVTDAEKKIQLQEYYGSAELLHQTVGWKAKTELRDGLQQTLAYFEKNKAHYL